MAVDTLFTIEGKWQTSPEFSDTLLFKVFARGTNPKGKWQYLGTAIESDDEVDKDEGSSGVLTTTLALPKSGGSSLSIGVKACDGQGQVCSKIVESTLTVDLQSPPIGSQWVTSFAQSVESMWSIGEHRQAVDNIYQAVDTIRYGHQSNFSYVIMVSSWDLEHTK